MMHAHYEEGLHWKSDGWMGTILLYRRETLSLAHGCHYYSSQSVLGAAEKEGDFMKYPSIEGFTLRHYPDFSSFLNFSPRIPSSLTNNGYLLFPHI